MNTYTSMSVKEFLTLKTQIINIEVDLAKQNADLKHLGNELKSASSSSSSSYDVKDAALKQHEKKLSAKKLKNPSTEISEWDNPRRDYLPSCSEFITAGSQPRLKFLQVDTSNTLMMLKAHGRHSERLVSYMLQLVQDTLVAMVTCT
jgi:hypothetical protein